MIHHHPSQTTGTLGQELVGDADFHGEVRKQDGREQPATSSQRRQENSLGFEFRVSNFGFRISAFDFPTLNSQP
jgi:hypothetical protein